MLCNKCGSQIPDNATESEFCGAKVDASADNSDTKVLNTDELAAAAGAAAEETAVDSDGIFEANGKNDGGQEKAVVRNRKKT